MKEFFLEDILRLTGFTRKDMRKYKEETEKSMTAHTHTHTYTQRLFGLVLISFVYHTFWFSEDREQKYLTEWCQAVQTSSVGQKQSTHATGFLPDSDCGTSGFKQVNHHHQNTPCSLLHLE